MPSLFERSAIDPRRSRGLAVAPRSTKPEPAPQQAAAGQAYGGGEAAALVQAWDGEPDIVKGGEQPELTDNRQLAERAESTGSSDESDDDVGKNIERRGLAQVVPWQAAKYAADEFAGKIPRSRIAWKRTPESCRMCRICCSCLWCCVGLVVLFGIWSLIDVDECSAECSEAFLSSCIDVGQIYDECRARLDSGNGLLGERCETGCADTPAMAAYNVPSTEVSPPPAATPPSASATTTPS